MLTPAPHPKGSRAAASSPQERSPAPWSRCLPQEVRTRVTLAGGRTWVKMQTRGGGRAPCTSPPGPATRAEEPPGLAALPPGTWPRVGEQGEPGGRLCSCPLAAGTDDSELSDYKPHMSSSCRNSDARGSQRQGLKPASRQVVLLGAPGGAGPQGSTLQDPAAAQDTEGPVQVSQIRS